MDNTRPLFLPQAWSLRGLALSRPPGVPPTGPPGMLDLERPAADGLGWEPLLATQPGLPMDLGWVTRRVRSRLRTLAGYVGRTSDFIRVPFPICTFLPPVCIYLGFRVTPLTVSLGFLFQHQDRAAE